MNPAHRIVSRAHQPLGRLATLARDMASLPDSGYRTQ